MSVNCSVHTSRSYGPLQSSVTTLRLHYWIFIPDVFPIQLKILVHVAVTQAYAVISTASTIGSSRFPLASPFQTFWRTMSSAAAPSILLDASTADDQTSITWHDPLYPHALNRYSVSPKASTPGYPTAAKVFSCIARLGASLVSPSCVTWHDPL